MNKIKSIILISALVILLASSAACAGTTTGVTTTVTASPPLAPTAQPVSTVPPATVTVTVTAPAVMPTPASSPSNTPTAGQVPGIKAPAADAKFFIQKEVTGFNKTLRIDGNYDQTPIYQDSFLSIPELYRYGPADAVYVPRIPTVTDHDDWFIRMTIPTAITKPWEVNWASAVKPGDTTTTVSFAIYTQDNFDAYYYSQPSSLATANLLNDNNGVSADGVHGLLLQDPGKYVILVRTNNTAGVAGWWMRIGR
jgi:hypothetical protein